MEYILIGISATVIVGLILLGMLLQSTSRMPDKEWDEIKAETDKHFPGHLG